MTSAISNFLAVGLGGAIGSMLRYAIALMWKSGFPFSTLLVNLLGSFILGFLAGSSLLMTDIKPQWRLMMTVGFCGGFTTFSTFSVQSFELFQSGKWLFATSNIIINVVGCILMTLLGYSLSKSLFAGV